MMLRKPVVVLAASLFALSGSLLLGAANPVLADARPTIVSITLDATNHAVVTWAKEPWQGSMDVKWSTGDGKVAAPDANWDGHYGLPLVDCYGQPLNDDPYGNDRTKGQWSYGKACRGQDVANDATAATTWNVLTPGVYYFQVTIAGENHETGAPCQAGSANDCNAMHYSGVSKLTVTPGNPNSPPPSSSPSDQPGSSGQPASSGQPGETRPQVLSGPGRFDLAGGGQVDVGKDGEVRSNPPFNLDVRFGQMHLAEDLVSFRCPSWTRPFPAETTLRDWIGVRCRTVTTPQAGALVKGTEFTVSVTARASTFQVFAGQIEVSDLAHRASVLVGPGQMTTVLTGETPSAPAAFDSSDPSLRWWGDRLPDVVIGVIVAVAVGLFFLVYFLPMILALARRRRRWQLVGLIDLLAGWTIVGWIAALGLALALPGSESTSSARSPVSPDGRWWWDGQVWRPMPARRPGRSA